MPTALVIKVVMVLAGLSGLAFGTYDYISTKQDNATLALTLESTAYALGEYATRKEQEVVAYTEAVKILGRRDMTSRRKRDEQFATIEGRDLSEMARRKPAAMLRIINDRTARLLRKISGTDSDPGRPAPASPSAP